MPRAALYEILVLSLCNALVGMFVVLSGKIRVEAGFLVFGASSWFMGMLLVCGWRSSWSRTPSWGGGLARATAAGLLGHPLFFFFGGSLPPLTRQLSWGDFLAPFVYPLLFTPLSLLGYGAATLYGALFLALLLGWWRRCSDPWSLGSPARPGSPAPRLAVPGAVR